MKRRGRLGWAAAAVAVLAFAGMLRLIDDPFLMVGGSDSTSFLIGPSVLTQILAVTAFAWATLPRARGLSVAVRLFVAFAALVMGGHRLVVDNVRGELRDTYLALPVARLKLDPTREAGYRLAFSSGGIEVGQVGQAGSLWLFSPVLLGLNRTTLRTVMS